MARLRHPIVVGLALFIMPTSGVPVHAAEGLLLVEQKIKAGLLYNFLKYTDWPLSEATPKAVVCLFGGDSFDGHLEPMAGRTVNQRAIEIKSVVDAQGTAGCALLIVHPSQQKQWPGVRTALAGRDILTVADYEGFAAAGGMIEFTRANDRIGVVINTAAVGSTRLKVQDRLLKLATPSSSGGGSP